MSELVESVAAAVSPQPEVTAPQARAAQPGPAHMAIRPASGCACGGSDGDCTCDDSGSLGYVYAIGTVTARFPSLNIEKEFMQAWGKQPTQVLTINDANKFAVLSQGQNFYLAREMCWIFQSGDIDVFILQPRSYIELTDLVTCLAPTGSLVAYSMIIGELGPIAPPSLCNGAQLPVVTCNQVFSFTQQAFLNSIVQAVQNDQTLYPMIVTYVNQQAGSTQANGGQSTAPASSSEPQSGSSPESGTPSTEPTSADPAVTTYITQAAERAFLVVAQLADNTGQSDQQRAINYLAFKSTALYTKEIEMEMTGFQLNSVTAQPDPVSQSRSIQDVIVLYANTTTTQIQRYFTRVDVTGQFPFLLGPLAIYYDHP
jgi:PatG C-terminal